MGNFDPTQPGGAIQIGPTLSPPPARRRTSRVSPRCSMRKKRTLILASAWPGTSLGTARRCCGAESASSPASQTVNAQKLVNQVPYGFTLCNSGTNVGVDGKHSPCPVPRISSSIDTALRTIRSIRAQFHAHLQTGRQQAQFIPQQLPLWKPPATIGPDLLNELERLASRHARCW